MDDLRVQPPFRPRWKKPNTTSSLPWSFKKWNMSPPSIANLQPYLPSWWMWYHWPSNTNCYPFLIHLQGRVGRVLTCLFFCFCLVSVPANLLRLIEYLILFLFDFCWNFLFNRRLVVHKETFLVKARLCVAALALLCLPKKVAAHPLVSTGATPDGCPSNGKVTFTRCKMRVDAFKSTLNFHRP